VPPSLFASQREESRDAVARNRKKERDTTWDNPATRRTRPIRLSGD
jgi:hypothetical protein